MKNLSVLNIPLEQNYFLKIILFERNLVWKNEIFSLLEAENVFISFDESNLMIKSNGSILPKTELEWLISINTIINNYYNQFHFEEINFNDSNNDDVFQMTKLIDFFKKICLIDYHIDNSKQKIWIIGRKSHVECFFLLNNNFKYLSKISTNSSNSNYGTDANNNNDSLISKNDIMLSNGAKKTRKRKVITLKQSYESTIKKSKND